MKKVKLIMRPAVNPIFAGISGSLGDIVFRSSKNGETIIAKRPRKSNAGPSEAQKANRERFAQANAYARAALADPDLRLSMKRGLRKSGKVHCNGT
jgi:hypothetical protein